MAWGGTPVQSASCIPMNTAAGTALNSAANYRMGFLGAMATPAPGGPMAWRAGVLSSAGGTAGPNIDLQVTQTATASQQVLVAAGTAVIPRSGGAGGPYTATWTSTSTVNADPASSTNPRIDLLCAQVIDAAIGDTGTQGGQLFIVNGTPNATPAVPATPTGAVALAQLYRATNTNPITNANITDVRKSAGMGDVRVLLPGDLSTDPGAFVGEFTFDAVTALKCGLRYWDGTTWRGTKQLTYNGAWANGTSNINIVGTKTAIAIATVPDPGYPYVARVSGHLNWSGYGAFTAGNAPYVQPAILLDSLTGTLISQSNGFAQSTNGLLDGQSHLTPKLTSTLTGAHTFYLSGVASSSSTICSYNPGYATGYTWLTVDIIPA